MLLMKASISMNWVVFGAANCDHLRPDFSNSSSFPEKKINKRKEGAATKTKINPEKKIRHQN